MSKITLGSPPGADGTLPQQLSQLRSYLFQMSEQLNVALGNLDEENFTGEIKKQVAGQMVPKAVEEKISDNYKSLKAAIIKTSEIINDEIGALSVSLAANYVAKSQFGEFTAASRNDITANTQGITQIYGQIENLQSDISGFEDYKLQTDSYIRTGLLYYETVDGVSVPRYGLAVGNNWTTAEVNGETVYEEKNYLSTFTAGKISFWHQGYEVAYMSNNKLYINYAEIIGNLKMGSWLIDTNNYGHGGWGLKWDGQ